ncbi:hypothetical protein CEXT_703951 [Caerostris extrusa]|uniref:Uncharacterized protein n=1 Tax=Caerostris extrusa TaxID=172846 RepID=A0AAV4NSP4_CAEEX|nr:hypothetical protein CEXT_703951 [Caerostris extrusa]
MATPFVEVVREAPVYLAEFCRSGVLQMINDIENPLKKGNITNHSKLCAFHRCKPAMSFYRRIDVRSNENRVIPERDVVTLADKTVRLEFQKQL